MKHPSHSRAKNEYLGKSSTSLSSKQKTKLQLEMKAFNVRLKGLLKDK